MTFVEFGDRIGKQGKIRLGCSGVLFDETRTQIFLTRRSDNGEWCLPGGGADAGESVSETVVREFLEETGIKVEVVALLGVYSSPHSLLVYPDGSKFQIVALNFEVKRISGDAVITEETTEFGFFSKEEIAALQLLPIHRDRIADAFVFSGVPFIK